MFAPRCAASAACDFCGRLFKIHKPDLEELIWRCKRSNRQGAREVQVGSTERPNPGLVEFFFRRVRRHLRKRQRRLKSLKRKKRKRKLRHFNEAVSFSEQRRRSGFTQSETRPSRGNSLWCVLLPQNPPHRSACCHWSSTRQSRSDFNSAHLQRCRTQAHAKTATK